MKTHNELPLFVIDEFLRLRFWPAMLKSVEINFIKIILVFVCEADLYILMLSVSGLGSFISANSN